MNTEMNSIGTYELNSSIFLFAQHCFLVSADLNKVAIEVIV